MKANYEAIVDAAMQLDAADRCRVATCLWESIGEPVGVLDADEFENVLNEREAELDRNPSLEINHQDFMERFAKRRCS